MNRSWQTILLVVISLCAGTAFATIGLPALGRFGTAVDAQYASEQPVVPYDRQLAGQINVVFEYIAPLLSQIKQGAATIPARRIALANAKNEMAKARQIPFPADYDPARRVKVGELLDHLDALVAALADYDRRKAIGEPASLEKSALHVNEFKRLTDELGLPVS